MLIDTEAFYRNLYRKHGDSPQTVAWSDERSQEERFQVLMEVAGGVKGCEGKRILDFGCGTGALAGFLAKRHINTKSYTGVDMMNDFLSCAAIKYPQHRFCKKKAIEESERFDYIFISGTFNLLLNDDSTSWNETFLFGTLRWCLEHCTDAIAFNLLSTYVDFQEPHLWYKAPDEVVRHIKSEFGNKTRFTLINDYVLAGGSIPSEYTVHLFKS